MMTQITMDCAMNKKERSRYGTKVVVGMKDFSNVLATGGTIKDDIRDLDLVKEVVKDVDAVFHEAALENVTREAHP